MVLPSINQLQCSSIFLLALLVSSYVESIDNTCSASDIIIQLYPNGGGGSPQNVTLDDLQQSGSNYYNSQGLLQDLSSPSTFRNHTTLYSAPTVPGTHFMWPLLPIGTKIQLSHPTPPTPGSPPIELEMLSHSPRIFYVHNFMSQAETDILIDFSTSSDNPYKMARSTGGTHKSWEQGGKADTLSTRTSMNAFDISTPTSFTIKRRAFSLLRIPHYVEAMADGIQVLRYELGQAYVAHHDFFPVGQSDDFVWDPKKGGANRMATVFLYLSDVDVGGQTCFPKVNRLDREEFPDLAERLDGGNVDMDVVEKYLKDAGIPSNSWEAKLTRDCYSKFSIPPKKGDAVLFYSQLPDGTLDSMSLHGAGPVLKGTKWGANVWVWNACRYSTCRNGMDPVGEMEFTY